jgi:predicted RecA/RadA family phage recombinase
MAKNYVQPGDHIVVENVDNTAAYDIAAGDGFLVGSLFGVALVDIPVGESGAIATEGVWELAKVSAQAWTVGAKIYWAAATKNCTTTASTNKQIGVAVEGAGNPSATGKVRLTGAFTI